jgi:hypothetical protein
LWLAARNAPLAAGVFSAGLAAHVGLAMRPGPPYEGRVVCGYLVIGAVMSLPARYASWQGLRAACVVVGALPSWLLGCVFLIQGRGGTGWIGLALLALWALAFHCVCFFGRAWTKEALVGAGCCLNCGYDRRGLGAEVVCPECGGREVRL